MRAIQLKTKPSRTLLITGVKDIGLRSESIDCGWGVFASGRTSALLFESSLHRGYALPHFSLMGLMQRYPTVVLKI